MSKRTKSSKRSSGSTKRTYSDDELIDYSVFDNITKKSRDVGQTAGSSKFIAIIIGAILVFSLLLATGAFSPITNSSNGGNGNGNNNGGTSGGNKIPVILYSSPTCGCCHNYVDYLNDNGFDTFQKRTDAYQDIKDQYGIPEDLRSCHTSIIGDYFVEGHVVISVIIDLLSEKPDIDGITLPGMPHGSPGMSGDKNMPWVFTSLKDGVNVGIFQTL